MKVISSAICVLGLSMGLAITGCSNSLEDVEVMLLGSIELEGPVHDLFVKDDVAYLAAGIDGLHLVDVSKPTSPRQLSTVKIDGHAKAVTVEGSTAYVTVGPAGWPIGFLTVVDVSEATSPATITQIELAGYRPYGVASDEHIVTIANGTEGLRIIDASDPKSPVEIGNLPTTNVVDVTVRGSYAYLADKSGLRIANVSNFTQPEQVAMLKTSGPCLDVSIEGDQALAATGENGIDIVDISNPFAPALRATIPVSPAVSVSLNDGIAAVGAAGAGVCLIDTTKPIDTPIQSLDISANGACTLFQGELLYISDMAIGRGPYGLGSRTTLRIYKVKRTRS